MINEQHAKLVYATNHVVTMTLMCDDLMRTFKTTRNESFCKATADAVIQIEVIRAQLETLLEELDKKVEASYGAALIS